MGRSWILLFFAFALLAPSEAGAKCNPGLVRYFRDRAAVPVAYKGGRQLPRPVSLQWFGHAFFRLISPGGTRVVTDPFSPERGFPIPKTAPHVVTSSEESANHSWVEIVGGKPIILRGVVNQGDGWARIDRKVGDVRILSVPIVQGGGEFDISGGKASSFLFETGGLCIAHLGDLGAPMNPEQLRRLGKVHVALVIISDPGAMGPEVLARFIHRLGPNIAIPMDVRSEEDLTAFTRAFRRVRRLNTDRIELSRRTLPRPTEVVVLRMPPLVR